MEGDIARVEAPGGNTGKKQRCCLQLNPPAPLVPQGYSGPCPSALPRDQPEALMSSWSLEPGMWALGQAGLALGLRLGVCRGGLASGFTSSGTVRGQGVACSAVLCLCVNVCVVYVRRQAPGQDQDRQSSLLGL